MNTKLGLGIVGAAALALVVGGCGGGGGGGGGAEPAATAAVAQPATISSALAFIAQQKALPSDDIDPQQLRQQLPPANDTIEPSPI